jgi:hypothetical protein
MYHQNNPAIHRFITQSVLDVPDTLKQDNKRTLLGATILQVHTERT